MVHHGAIFHHVEVGDFEVPSDVARHPGVVNPEELEPGGSLYHGSRSARGGDVDPASAVVGIDISLGVRVPGQLFKWYVPLTADFSLGEITVKMTIAGLSHPDRHPPPDGTHEEPVLHVVGRLEVPGSQDQHLVQVNVLVVVCLHHKLGL